MKNSLLLFLFFSLSAVVVLAQPYAYVPNFSGGDVSVVDLNTNTVTTTITVGASPFSSVANSITQKVYIANRASNTVSVIDASTNTVETTINVGTEPQALALSPDGTLLYVPNKQSDDLTVINTTDNSIVTTIASVGTNPYSVAVSPDGNTVYVAADQSNAITVIDAATNTVSTSIPLGSRVSDIIINAAGTKAYVSTLFPDNVKVIDLATNMVTNTITVGTAPLGLNIGGAAFDKLYVCNRNSSNISVINLGTEMVETTISIGGQPVGVDVSADGGTIYTTDFIGNALNIIDATANMSTGSVTVGSGPWSLGDFILDGLLPGEMCTNAIDINSLFGQAVMVPQLSEEYNLAVYDVAPNDPTSSSFCGFDWEGTTFIIQSVWFGFTGDGNTYTISSTGNIDPFVVVYSGECGALTELACNDDTGNDLNFSLEFETEPGVQYLLYVARAGGTPGPFNIQVTNESPVNVQDIRHTALNVFPNPTNGWVQLDGFTADRVEVLDQFGRTVRAQSQAGTNVDLTGLPAGVYLLRMQAGTEVYSAKVVKE